MEKFGIEKDLQVVAFMTKFVRTKRGLSQKEVAAEAGISQATVASLESCNFKKTSAKNIGYIFRALRLNNASLKDPSLYQLILQDKTNNIWFFLGNKYNERADTVAKIFSCTCDAYTASGWWKINIQIANKSKFFKKLVKDQDTQIKEREPLRAYPLTEMDKFNMETGFPNYLPSSILFEILNAFPKKVLERIFFIDDFILDCSEDEFEDELLDVWAHYDDDPFVKIMEHLKIPFINGFSVIKDILNAAQTTLRLSSFEHLEREVKSLLGKLQSFIACTNPIADVSEDNTKSKSDLPKIVVGEGLL